MLHSRGSEAFLDFLFGRFRGSPEPGRAGVRQKGDEFIECPFPVPSEGGVAERVGETPTDLDEIVDTALAGDRLVVVGSEGGGEFVREIPVLGQVGAGGAGGRSEKIELRL